MFKLLTKRDAFWWLFVLCIFFPLWTGACAPGQATILPTETPNIPLTPYHTPTSTLTPPSQSDTAEGAATSAPKPTATPFLYQIQSGDTLLVVAKRYNITLDDLLASNPEIDPNFLIVGDEIIIPTGEESLAAFPSPTPVAVSVAEPHCYSSVDQGLWCLALVSNRQGSAVENLSVKISLFSSEGEELEARTAIPPLNVLPPGDEIPVAVFFPPPRPDSGAVSAQASLQAALPVAPDSERYLPVEVDVAETRVRANNATVKGMIRLTNADSPPAQEIWLAAIAYDESGHPVGVRKWTAVKTLQPGDNLDFSVFVYTVGPAIADVELMAEARP